MSNNRELSQIANLVEVIDETGHINIKQPAAQNIGVGITAPTAKVHVVGDATITTNLNVGGNIVLGSNLRSSGLAVTNHVTVGGATTLATLTVIGQSNLVGLTSTIQLNVTGLTTTQNLAVAGFSTFYNDVRLDGGEYIFLGDSNYSSIYASGSPSNNSVTISQNSLSGNGYLLLKGDSVNLDSWAGGGISVRENPNDVGHSEVLLKYDGFERLRTVGTGITVSGSVGVTTNIHVFGNIGINTDSPTERLHVDGNVYISGTINAGTVTGSISEANYSPIAGVSTVAIGLTQYPNIEVTSIGSTIANVTQTLNVGPSGSFFTADTAGVGIQTQTPNAPLDVYGNAKIDDGFDNAIIGTEDTGFTLQSPLTIGFGNVLIGKNAGYSVNSGNENTFVGINAGQDTTGGRNVFLGSGSGSVNTTGSNNVCIGYNRSSPIIAGSNQLSIGAGNTDWINGDSSYNVGIGITIPIAKLDVNGSIISRNTLLSGNLRVDNAGSITGVTLVTTNQGLLGIGITPSIAKLEVSGSSLFYGPIGVGETVLAAAGTFKGAVASQVGGEPNLMVSSSNPSSIPATIFSNSSTGTLQIFSGGLGAASQRGGQIDYVGGNSALYPGQLLFRTGINTGGTSQPITARLDTFGVLYANTFTSTSDERLKTNIEKINNPLEILNDINGVTFNWKDGGDPSVGVIAQDVEKVLPEAVKTDPEGMKSVCYDMLIGVLVEAIKDQQKRIDDLEARLNENQ